MQPDHYTILGLAPSASNDEIKRAYRRRVRETHPDVTGGEPEAFRLVQAAWETLGDGARRVAYDRERATHATTEPGAGFGDVQAPSFDGFYADIMGNLIAEHLQRAAQQQQTRVAEAEQMQHEVAALREPLFPLNLIQAGLVLGRAYASYRLTGVPYAQVAGWRRLDAWLVRGLVGAWVVLNVVLMYTIIGLNGLNLSNFMGWLFALLVSTFVGILVLVSGLFGLQAHRWVNYNALRRHMQG